MKCITLFFLSISIFITVEAQTHSADQYRIADSIAGIYSGHSLYNLPDLANKLTTQMPGEHDKIRSIYTWVSTNISNDFDTYFRNKIKRWKYRNDPKKLAVWNKKISQVIFKNLLTEHKSICSGYAYLIQELAQHAGLDCKIINGYGKNNEKEILQKGNPNHSWNAIKIDGEWLFIDATWSSGMYKMEERKFVKDYDDTYFLVRPELFLLNHYPIDIADAHTGKVPNLTTFLESPYIKKSAIQLGISPVNLLQHKIWLNKGDNLLIMLQTDKPESIDQIDLKMNKIPVSAIVSKPGSTIISIQYKMQKAGSFLVEVYLNNHKAVSYRLTVKK